MKIIIITLLACSLSFAQEYKQVYGTSSSVGGTSSSATQLNRSIVGQPVIGDVFGGNIGSHSGFAAFKSALDILTESPAGPAPLPESYEFRQNYPNPFNPSTTLEFALPQATRVRLIVFDILGREVGTLIDANLSAGNYRQTFEAPATLASGLYFAVFDAGDFHQVRKMMLLK